MIKKVVIPKSNSIKLSIPDNYIGKEIEVLVYAKEELAEEKTSKVNDAARFKGLLTVQEADMYHAYLKKARSEWDRGI